MYAKQPKVTCTDVDFRFRKQRSYPENENASKAIMAKCNPNLYLKVHDLLFWYIYFYTKDALFITNVTENW